ncbi:Aldehyde dehydrogenase [Modicella reniformis]|uniref:Aldehyde dehydrogenase n=1 Tax=Modicella reniformis TaxID=1440133 RepID=A0A9P6IN62_9FUNG|nr:Aldehyde dehydrogenase [Modicella reniformis]
MATQQLRFSDKEEIKQAVANSRLTFQSGHTRPLKFRRHQLEQLWRMLDENENLLCDAVYSDLHKHKNEVIPGEICTSKEEIHLTLLHLEEWARDEKTSPSLVAKDATCIKRKEPKGSTLIIAPWNYPIYLVLGPLIGAIAAGCTAVVKPSEVAPHTAQVMTDLIRQYLDNKAYIVINGGTCVAPDYILITEKGEAKLIPALKTALKELYGEDPQESKDYGRIVNVRHFKRLCDTLMQNKSGQIVIGGQADEDDLYIAPTVISDVARDDTLMEEELFGPLLPIIRVADVDDAIEYINSKHDPLALYVFSSNKKFVNKVLESTRSGGALVNDTLMHVVESSLPFGGRGNSGMGTYHGKDSFDAFTQVRSIMFRGLNPVVEKVLTVRYPPYSKEKLIISKLAFVSVPQFKQGFIRRYMKWVVLAVVFGFGYKRAIA